MKASAIFLIVFILLVAVGIALFFVFKNIDKRDSTMDLPKYDFYHSVYDSETKARLDCNFTVYYNQTYFSIGTTNNIGYEKTQLPIDGTKDLVYDCPGYYSNATMFFGMMPSKDIIVTRVGKLEMDYTEFSNNVSSFNVTFKSNGTINNPKICINWGISLKDVVIENLVKTNITSRWQGRMSNCYDLGKSINGPVTIKVNYNKLKMIGELDYIRLIVIDRTPKYNVVTHNFEEIDEDSNKKDVGLKDVEYTLKPSLII